MWCSEMSEKRGAGYRRSSGPVGRGRELGRALRKKHPGQRHTLAREELLTGCWSSKMYTEVALSDHRTRMVRGRALGLARQT